MSLSLYNKKRHFNKTAEPKGTKKSSKGALTFVIQKHDATSLHYDLRLEMEGVLKSWAVPKGPSLNPQDKRLAMAVEDHPFSYRTFEGIIPAGEYGGGTVIVWDEGTYTPMNGEELSRKEQEKLLLEQLKKGDLKIHFEGQKIQGDFALFKIKGRGENTWLLVKKKDDFATSEDVTQQSKSIKSGKTLTTVAEEHGVALKHPEEKSGTTKKAKNQQTKSRIKSGKESKPIVDVNKILSTSKKLASKTSMPKKIKPMLATLVEEPFDDPEWFFEIKWDGYRAVAYCDKTEAHILSRNNLSFSERYPSVTKALKELNIKAVFDGEIIAVNEEGMADFQMLQNWQKSPVQLQFYIFDILWLEGYNLTKIPALERKRILKEVLPAHDIIKFSDHIKSTGKDFFEVAKSKGLEGIIAKNGAGIYKIGARSDDWLKIKVNQRQEVIIVGFTKPRNTRQYFGSLLLGVYDGEELKYAGHTGSGFNAESLKEIYEKLQPLVVKNHPFVQTPKTNETPTWVKPKLVCEIKFTEWTKEGSARHPIFMGLRTDKDPKDVQIEKSVDKNSKKVEPKSRTKIKAASRKTSQKKAISKKEPPKKTSTKKAASKAEKKLRTQKGANTLLTLDFKVEKDQQIVLNGHELALTNLNKIYWKKEKFFKGDMINYYLAIAPYMLPYMLDRPQSLNRHPNGIDGKNFYQKDVRGKVPDWMQTHEDFVEAKNSSIDYLVCKDEATLIYMANLGCIEMNPWHSRTKTWEYPDWCLIDLDPDTKNSFEQVIEVAHVVKQVLDDIGAPSYPKTSGSTGIHIYIPLGAKYTFDQSKQLAELVVNLVCQELPDITSVVRSPAKRKGKIYLDFLQNRQIQTAAAPYSLRPKPGVPVSTPLNWEEIKKGLTQTTYNAKNILDKLKSDGDPFTPVLGKGIQLDKVLKKLQSLYK